MKRKPEYEGAKYIGNDKACYGSKVTAYFYVGDKIKEGDPFGSNEDTAYINDMGSDWEKGHMLAKSLGGDNKTHNLLPMKEEVNNSTFKSVENFVHTLIDNLPAIQKLYGEGNLHIKYTVERIKNSTMKVKGYEFPGKFSYSIEIHNDDDTAVNYLKIMKVLKVLGISCNVKFSNTISVE